jgi:hypothetical protein
MNATGAPVRHVVPLVLKRGDMDTVVLGYRETAVGRATRTAPIQRRAWTTDVYQAPIVFTIFLVTQLLDGVLTYWGVSRFGIDLEMNALLASSMESNGPGATLLYAKALSCACGLVLYASGSFRPLAAISGLCLGLAVVPWLLFWVYALHI